MQSLLLRFLPLCRLVGSLAIIGLLSACTLVPFKHGTCANEPEPATATSSINCAGFTWGHTSPDSDLTHLPTEKLSASVLPNGVFVGVAMSGGGSRAANFSAAALLALQREGFLQHVAAISSVSGSSLTAAYYGLFRDTPQWQNETIVRERLQRNFQTEWLKRWFYPHHIVRFWFTQFDRSDIMKQVFDDLLFEHRNPPLTFGDMTGRAGDSDRVAQSSSTASPEEKLPKILINASTLNGENFTFTKENFKTQLNSRIDSYPVSHAVMASAAFPGAMNNVTLQNYNVGKPEQYLHLLDGGPTDNLGVKALRRTLINVVNDSATAQHKLRGCFLFLVDVYPDVAGATQEQQVNHDHRRAPDSRKLLDYILDSNLQDAYDQLLSNHRIEMLSTLGYRGKKVGEDAYWRFKPFMANGVSGENTIAPEGSDLVCHVWHLTFQRLRCLKSKVLAPTCRRSGVFLYPYNGKDDRFPGCKPTDPACPPTVQLTERVSEIKTRFRLRANWWSSSNTVKQIQDDLFCAADTLVTMDEGALGAARAAFLEWSLPVSDR